MTVQIENNEIIRKDLDNLERKGQTHRVIIVDGYLNKQELNPCSQYAAHQYAYAYNRRQRFTRKRHQRDARAYVQRLEGLGRITP